MDELIELKKKTLRDVLEKFGQTMKGFSIKNLKESGMPEAKAQEIIASYDDVSEEQLIDFTARLPRKTFGRVLVNISKSNAPRKEVNPKDYIKNWLISSGTLRSEWTGYMLNSFPKEDNPKEFEKFQKFIDETPDDELAQWMVDTVGEDILIKMCVYAPLVDMVREAKDEEQELTLSAQVVKTNDYHFAEDNEEELIEELNMLEYERDEPFEQSRLATLFRTSHSKKDIREKIRYLQSSLATLQGGTLDRFNLRNRSIIELEHLLENTQAEIEEMESHKIQRHEAVRKIGEHFNLPIGLSDLLPIPNPYRYDLYIKKKLLSEIKLRLKLKQSSAQGAGPQERAAQVAAEIQQMNETITLLEQQRDNEVKKYPGREEEIMRHYRKAIDALKDKA